MTKASETLEKATEPKETTTSEVEALARFMKLSPDDRQRVLDFLEKVDDSAFWKKGAGVPDDYAERSRKSLKRNEDLERLDQETEMQTLIQEYFPDFSPEIQEQFCDLFFEYVDSRQNQLRDGLTEIFSNNPHFSLMFEDIDVAELLAERIQILQETIAAVEDESATLQSELAPRLTEETIFAHPLRKSKKSFIEEDMLTADEDNEFLKEENQKANHIADPKMRSYADFLERTTRGSDGRTPASDLVETWKVTNQN